MMSSDLFTTEKHWPQRLLQLDGDSIRSVELSGSSTYGSIIGPQYNIISYTWGRWEIDKGEALLIHNVNWKIPAISSSGFTVAGFANVLKHVSQGSHVWLDVGCIEQENQTMKMREIGRQAAIFRGAQKAYIWLSHSKRNVLKPFILEALKRDALVMDHGFRPWLNRVEKAVGIIFSDPWFSSLWTLQEGFLRPDAILLFDDASVIDIPKFESYSGGGPCTLLDIVKGYQAISSQFYGIIKGDSDVVGSHGVARAREVLQRLDDVGVPCLAKTHAVALYGVASRRNPMREHDRIYGIMQVFGLVLGKSAQPDMEFTLPQLEDQLGGAVNRMNPVVAQSFIHLGNPDPRPNRRWCLSRNMFVFSSSPVQGREVDRPEPYCRITFDDPEDCAIFHGYKASFEDLASRLRGPYEDKAAFLTLHFDHTKETRSKLPELYFDSYARYDDPRLEYQTEEVGKVLQQSLSHEIVVLLIGSMEDNPARTWLGVIAYPLPTTGISSKVRWARVGVCTWMMHIDAIRSKLKDLFQKQVLCLG